MEPDADLAALGRLIGDPNRARMLQVLLGGTPQSGSALASALGISRSLASAHLKKLTAGGLVRAERSGRQQLYSIAAQPVADALETLLLFAPATPGAVAARLDAHAQPALGADVLRPPRGRRRGRRHRGAGRPGRDRLAGRRVGAGAARAPRYSASLGVDVAGVPRRTRPLLRPCMDWTERRHHLAGGLGAALADELLRRGWVRRQEGSRIVTVTRRRVRGPGVLARPRLRPAAGGRGGFTPGAALSTAARAPAA